MSVGADGKLGDRTETRPDNGPDRFPLTISLDSLDTLFSFFYWSIGMADESSLFSFGSWRWRSGVDCSPSIKRNNGRSATAVADSEGGL